MSETPLHERLAYEAGVLARDAYEAARASDNPYAVMMVTQKLAEGGLVRLSTARRDTWSR